VDVEIWHKYAGSRERVLEVRDIPVQVSPGRPLKVRTLEGEFFPGTVVRMRLSDEKRNHVVTNCSFPAMEIPRTRIEQLKDKVDARFDGWWREHMTTLMRIDRLRSDYREWSAKKVQMDGKKPID
jgi:hypothetical protein